MSGEKPGSKRIIFSPTARKQFLNLDKSVQLVEKLRFVLPQGDIIRAKGREEQYRLRVGDWRIIFRRASDIEILAILPRGQAYK